MRFVVKYLRKTNSQLVLNAKIHLDTLIKLLHHPEGVYFVIMTITALIIRLYLPNKHMQKKKVQQKDKLQKY